MGNNAKYSFPSLPSLPPQRPPTVRDSMSFQYPSFGILTGRSLSGIPRTDSLEVLQNYLGNSAHSILQLPTQVAQQVGQLPKQNSLGGVPSANMASHLDPGAMAAAAHAKAF